MQASRLDINGQKVVQSVQSKSYLHCDQRRATTAFGTGDTGGEFGHSNDCEKQLRMLCPMLILKNVIVLQAARKQ